MHDTAYLHGRLFFELYGFDALRTVVELGSQDVNGSLRDHCPAGIHYIGLDLVPAKGVDLVVRPGGPIPLGDDVADVVLSSSAFEHDVCFWDTFLELVRILRPGGLLYMNAPSNGGFHRHPVDCWRFYPDAGVALAGWASRNGADLELIESFIGQPQDEGWADFVAVFRKAGGGVFDHRGRIADHVPAINISAAGAKPGAPLEAEAEDMPDMRILSRLQTELAANLAVYTKQTASLSADLLTAGQSNAKLADDLTAKCNEVAVLCHDLTETVTRVHDLEEQLAQVRWELAVIQNSTSWRMTAGLRRLMRGIRGR